MTPWVEAMARSLTMLGGAKLPELVLDRAWPDGKTNLDGCGSEELRTCMLLLKESLEMGAKPLGWVFESTNGFERVPVTPGDQNQIDLLAAYDQMLEEKAAADYSSKS
jgi:hypothetical protein